MLPSAKDLLLLKMSSAETSFHWSFTRVLKVTFGLAAESMDAVGSTPEECTQRMEREIAKWAAVVKAAGVTADDRYLDARY